MYIYMCWKHQLRADGVSSLLWWQRDTYWAANTQQVSLSLSLSHTHIHTHTHSLSLSLSLRCSVFSSMVTERHILSSKHTAGLSLSLSLSLTHTHTHTHTHTLSLSLVNPSVLCAPVSERNSLFLPHVSAHLSLFGASTSGGGWTSKPITLK